MQILIAIWAYLSKALLILSGVIIFFAARYAYLWIKHKINLLKAEKAYWEKYEKKHHKR